MKKTISLLLLSFLLITNASIAQNKSIEFTHGTFSEILAKAKKENKMVYIDCYTVWCGPCKWMAKNIFTNDTVADFYNKNFVSVEIDMEKGEGLEIAKKYEIRAYPTMLYLNSEGVQLHRTCGSTPAKNFIANGENALSPNKQLATYSANFKEGKVNAEFASIYFSMLENGCQSYDTELNKYFGTVSSIDLRARSNWEIIYKYVEDYYSRTFQVFEEDKTAFVKLYGADSVENKINQIYTSGLYSALQNKDMVVYESLKTKLRASNTKDAEKIILQADIKRYQRAGDLKIYASSVNDYVTKYSMENANELNSFAWTFYEDITDKKMLEKAEIWSKKATELDNNYPYNDTYAAVLFKLGKKVQAKTVAEKAIELAKKSGDDYKETQSLLDKINGLK